MRSRAAIVLTLASALLLLLPASSIARQTEASVVHVKRATEGKPWAGSYLKSSLRVTHSRVVWLKWRGAYSTWADGGYDWNRVWGNTNMGVSPSKVTGSVSKVLAWEWPTMTGSMDFGHPNGGQYISAGRVKVRLKPGNGTKIIKIHYNLRIVQQWNGVGFVPDFPVSSTYRKSIRLAM